jgi:hypothetical protein
MLKKIQLLSGIRVLYLCIAKNPYMFYSQIFKSNKMKNTIFLVFVFLISQTSISQVPKKIVVEHFTNTKCGICANRNPGFYTTYFAQSGLMHMSVHPSSPYSTCVLSQHNPSENDARTNYYGIYGGTPRLVIQGVVIPSNANYSSASIYTPYVGQVSPASIKIQQAKFGSDSIRVRIVVKTEASHSLPALSLFVALAEDTLNYTGSNGEPVHYDVFRKSLTGATGMSLTLPATVGDSVVYTMSSTVNSAWNFARIFTLAILQQSVSKAVVQTENISASTNNLLTSISSIDNDYSNISVKFLNKTAFISHGKTAKKLSLTIYDLAGRTLFNNTINSTVEQFDLSQLNSGIYLYSIKSEKNQIKSGKFLLQ